MFPGTCDHILRKIVKKYNLDPICFHELRHTCASLLINSGVDPKTVSKRLGHSDTSITMEIYTHAFEESKKSNSSKKKDENIVRMIVVVLLQCYYLMTVSIFLPSRKRPPF